MPEKKIVLVLVFFVLCFSAHAQLKVGVNGGVVLSSLVRDSNLAANDGTVGYLIGANLKYNLGELKC